MSNLEKVSREITESVKNWANELIVKKDETNRNLTKTVEDMQAAASEGDLSENSAYTEAIEKIKQLNAQMGIIGNQLRALLDVEEPDDYVSIGMVIPYSTVKLEIEGEQEEMIYKVYPGSLSDLSKRVIAQDSEVGQAIFLQEVGYEFDIIHRVTKQPVHYKILEIY